MENYLRDLLDALGARGVKTAALVHDDGAAESAPGADRSVAKARVWFTVAFAAIAPAFPRLLGRLIASERPDLLHLHVPNLSAFWALLSPRARRLPWVVHWHADVPLSEHKWQLRLLYRFYRPFEQWLLRRARLVIVTSPPYLDSSPALAPWLEKCRVIPLGIRPLQERHASGDSAAGNDTARLKMLAVGRLSYYKGFDLLLRAVAATPGVTLDLLGDGEERSRLAALVRALRAESRITLHGQVTDEERLSRLAACDCLCLPSIERSEAFGLVLLEAMAAGKACVATAVPGSGMAWVVEHEKTGLVVPPGDPEALAGALRFLAEDPEERRAMGAAGRTRFQAHFHIDRSADQVLAAYRELLAP